MENASPYNSHPLYRLRLALIFLAAVSIFLVSISLGINSSDCGPHVWHIILSIFSTALCSYDLIRWANHKTSHPDEEPAWPLRRIMAADLILAFVFFFDYVAEVGSYSFMYRYGDQLIPAYATLTALASCALHFICFWKQLIASKKAEWQASLHEEFCQCRNLRSRNQIDRRITNNLQPTSSHEYEPIDQKRCSACNRGTIRDDNIDIEASAGRSTTSAPLATPKTDDELTSGEEFGNSYLEYQNIGYGTTEPRLPSDTPGVPAEIIVKRKKKCGKEKLSRGKRADLPTCRQLALNLG